MSVRLIARLSLIALPLGLYGQTATPPTNILNPEGSNLDTAFQVSYASNLNLADGVVNITNAGSSAANVAATTGPSIAGNICVNAYVYQPAGALLSCCSCVTTPNGLYSWPVVYGPAALLSNNAAAKPSSVVIKLVATSPVADITAPSGVCDPTFQNAPLSLVPGLTAFETHPHVTANPSLAITETPFKSKALSVGEAYKLQTDCNALGTPKQCPSCLVGGLAAPAGTAEARAAIQ